GALIGPDHQGVTVLAAFTYIPALELGLLVKLDLAEVRRPFLKAALWGGLASMLPVLLGSLMILWQASPVIRRFEEREAVFRRTFDQAPIPATILNLDLKYQRVNAEFCRLTGYMEEELLGMGFQDITHPEDLAEDMKRVEDMLSGRLDSYQRDKRYIRKDGEVVWARLSERLVRDAQGRPQYFLPMMEDITEKKRAEDRIKAALQEKEVLLREIHHRVKNNMQVVSSLLNLQAHKIEDPEMRAVFQESQDRIRTMALIHESLYQSGNMARIDLERYLTRLAGTLFMTYDAAGQGIDFQVEAPGVTLGLDQAVPCGLAVNEILTNSLKYAFPRGGPGRITITGRWTEDGRTEISIMDNGTGLPDDLDLRRKGALGLPLVVSLVESQLRGEIKIEGRGGTRVTMTFGPADEFREE
ncbi:MAG: histidine kinase dimerization/phosphoacceptor domain -containing protein, partial [Thermodesulfobacteriota bacterium]